MMDRQNWQIIASDLARRLATALADASGVPVKVELLKCHDCERISLAVDSTRVTSHKCSGRWFSIESVEVGWDDLGKLGHAPKDDAVRGKK